MVRFSDAPYEPHQCLNRCQSADDCAAQQAYCPERRLRWRSAPGMSPRGSELRPFARRSEAVTSAATPHSRSRHRRVVLCRRNHKQAAPRSTRARQAVRSRREEVRNRPGVVGSRLAAHNNCTRVRVHSWRSLHNRNRQPMHPCYRLYCRLPKRARLTHIYAFRTSSPCLVAPISRC